MSQRFFIGKKQYDIPDDVKAEFLKDNPNAVAAINYNVDGKKYSIPTSLKNSFIQEYPNAVLDTKIKVDIKTPPQIKIIIGDNDQDKLNSFTKNLSTKQYQPEYTSTSIKAPEVQDMNKGFFQGLQNAFVQTQERVQFFKENPKKAEEIKGQATAYQFEPLLQYLDPKKDEPIQSRVGKELLLLTALQPVMYMTMFENPKEGIVQTAEFLSEVAMNWVNLLQPPKFGDSQKRKEAWSEIKRSPLFHTLPLFGVARKAQKMKGASPKQKEKIIKEVNLEIENFKKTAEQIYLENPQFFKEIQTLARSQAKTLDFNKEIIKSKRVKLLPEPKPTEKILKINTELANLLETKKQQQQNLKDPNLTPIQRTQIESSLGRVNELINETRSQGQQLGYSVNIDILPDKNISTEKGIKKTVDIKEYFNDRIQGKGYNPSEIDRLYNEVTNNVILLPESKGQHKQIQDLYEKSFKEMSGYTVKSWQDTKRKLVRGIVDVSGNIKKELRESGAFGERASTLHDLALGTNAKASMIYENAAKNIFGDLTKNERKLLDTIIEARRDIAIRDYKPNYKITNKTGGYESTLKYLEELKKSDVRLYDKLNQRADNYFKEQKTNLKELFDNGLINEAVYNKLKDKEYSRKEYLPEGDYTKYIDPEITQIQNGRKTTVTSSGLKNLEEGSGKLRNLDQSSKLFRDVSMIQGRVAKNKANLAFREMIRKNPDNGIGIELKPGEKVPKGYSPISYYEKGQKKEFYIRSEFANEWVASDPLTNSTVNNFLSVTLGTRALKFMATGANPEFALFNLARDIGYTYLKTSEYSPHLPKFGAQMAIDIATIAPDVIKRKGRYRDYIMEGGGMEFLTHQGGFGKTYKPTGKISNTFEAFQAATKYLGETSELFTRLALRERALKNGKSRLEATGVARNLIDFQQGGNAVKFADNFAAYLNANVQATRGLVSAAKTDPKLFASKSAWISATASSLWFANNLINPKAYNDIDERIKNDNWVFTTAYQYADERGNKRYLYFKFPKDTGQKLVASGTDAMLEKTYQGKDAPDQVIEAIKDLASVVPTADPLPPLLDALIMGAANYDWFKGEAIYDNKGKPIDPTEEKTPRTGRFFVDLGKSMDDLQLFGIDFGEKVPDMFKSPAKLEYMTKQFTTHRNIWTDLVGGGYKALTGQQDEKVSEEMTIQMLRDIPGIRRFVSFTNPYKEDKELTRTYISKNTEDKKAKDYVNKLYKEFKKGSIKSLEVLRAIKQSEFKNKPKLIKRFRTVSRMKKVKNVSFMYDLIELGEPNLKAQAFFDKWKVSSKEEQDQLIKDAINAGRIITNKFNQRFNTLKKGYDKYKNQ